MNKYFFKITNWNLDKNKLYAAFRGFVNEWDNSIIKGDPALKAFQKMLQDKLKELNEEHKRCKDISMVTFRDHENELHIQVENSWYATVYTVKTEID